MHHENKQNIICVFPEISPGIIIHNLNMILIVAAVSMRDIWQDIKAKLDDLFDIVYDYLAGMGVEDYKRAALLLSGPSGVSTQLAMLVLETASSALGKKILSSITAA